jgi:hypothetical protein
MDRLDRFVVGCALVLIALTLVAGLILTHRL